MTLIARPTPPSASRPELAVPAVMVSTCVCQDKDLDRLRELMSAGMPQADASRLLWSPEPTPSPGMPPRAWATAFVRQSFAAAFPWLRLPTPTGVS